MISGSVNVEERTSIYSRAWQQVLGLKTSFPLDLAFLRPFCGGKNPARKYTQKDDERHVFAIIRVLVRYDGDFVSKKIRSGHELMRKLTYPRYG